MVNDMELYMVDTETGKEYTVTLSTISFAFPGLKTGGERLEAFILQKNHKYGDFQELTSLVLRNGRLEMVNW
jgi:hypothetical protein